MPMWLMTMLLPVGMLARSEARLSPVLVDRVLTVLTKLRDAGTAVLLVEQVIEKALAVADRGDRQHLLLTAAQGRATVIPL
jgi:ABC-type branched-subunit amino acid transport system ATPase component